MAIMSIITKHLSIYILEWRNMAVKWRKVFNLAYGLWNFVGESETISEKNFQN
jgi:hypothetical protein